MVELIKLEIEGFGKFAKKKVINFDKGINFITGLNESGKSTILEAILASIFKYSNTKIEPFISWENKDVCRLVLTYKTDKGETFRITSDYKNSKKKLEKITASGSTEVSTTISTIYDYIKNHFGFDEQKVFENTTFIRQSQMAMLSDATTKNKLRDMIEEVLVGSAEASATKALKKIKQVAKDSKEELEQIGEEHEELKTEFQSAEERKSKLDEDAKKQENVSKDLTSKSEKFKELKENKKLFDEKETLLKEEKGIKEKIEQIDEMIETLEGEKPKIVPSEKSKALPIILIVIGALISLTEYGALIGIPLIIVGVYLLVKKEEPVKKPKDDSAAQIEKYTKKKKDLINNRATVETKLEKYKLVNFTIQDFKNLEKLEGEVDALKSSDVQLKTSISTTKQLVKSPEEVKEGLDTAEQKIIDLKEKIEEHNLAYSFLEKAETHVQQKFTPAIAKNSKDILKEVTNEKYQDLKVNEEDLAVLVKAPEIKDFVSVDVLSQGAKDQIYFALRTTMTDLLSGNINIPMIFDDPFHNFDDIRLNKTIQAIKKISKKKQVILISHKSYQKDFKNFVDNIIEI